MDRYQKVTKQKAETPINHNEIRITAQGLIRNYISYATTLLQERGEKEIVLKAMGQAISKTVAIAEIIKKRIAQLHQDTAISSVSITDVWEPIEEGLVPVEMTRHVSMISITLSTTELDKNSPGYQSPVQVEQPRGQYYQQKQQIQQGRAPFNAYTDDSYGRGRGRERGRGRGWRGGYDNYQGGGRGGYDNYQGGGRGGYDNYQGGGRGGYDNYQGGGRGGYDNYQGGGRGGYDNYQGGGRGGYDNNYQGGGRGYYRGGDGNYRGGNGNYRGRGGGRYGNYEGGVGNYEVGDGNYQGGNYQDTNYSGGYSNRGRGGARGRGGWDYRGTGYERGRGGRGGYMSRGRGGRMGGGRSRGDGGRDS